MTRNARRCTLLILAGVVAISAPLAAQDRAQRVRDDLESFQAGGRWIYNDLPRGFEEAQKTGKPLLVVFRCIPCEACRGFDEQVASFDPRIQKLLERFVRVRIPQANGLDLSLFRFDFDLSFAAIFLNAERTIYGRFGSRSTQEDKKGDVSMSAFRAAMEAVLELHERYPEVKDSLLAKTGPAPAVKVPEEYPPFKGRYTSDLDYQGKVVQSCLHCHQIHEAERLVLRSAGKPIPDEVLFPWPLPEVFGLHLDPRRRATVSQVDGGSVAARAGFRKGDELVSLEGQPLVSIADVQWVLHNAGEEGELAARVRRGKEELALAIPLGPGWRRGSDISWRASTWDLRRMGTGGLLLEELPERERQSAGIAEGALALRVKHAGEYGEHAAAKNAGVRKGDIIIAVDGRSDLRAEAEVLALALQKKTPSDRLELTLLRGGERKQVSFRLR
jgi:serine protease Do